METNQKTTTSTPTVLVLSGGGIYGYGLLGLVQAMMDYGDFKNIHTLVGTSVGSIIGYLLIIGYTPLVLMQKLCTEMTVLENEFSFGQWDVMNCFYGHRGAVRYSILQDLLEKWTLDLLGTTLTMKQLEERFHKKWIVCTYNQTRDEKVFLHSENYPHLPCLLAIRMSCALPFLFEPCLFKGERYIDGGIVENIPISITLSWTTEKVLVCYFGKEEDDPVVDDHPPRQEPLQTLFRSPLISSSSSSYPTSFLNQVVQMLDTFMFHQIENTLHMCASLQPNLQLHRLPIRKSNKQFFDIQLSRENKFHMFSIGYRSWKSSTKNTSSCLTTKISSSSLSSSPHCD